MPLFLFVLKLVVLDTFISETLSLSHCESMPKFFVLDAPLQVRIEAGCPCNSHFRGSEELSLSHCDSMPKLFFVLNVPVQVRIEAGCP